jgi:hypothetical protein
MTQCINTDNKIQIVKKALSDNGLSENTLSNSGFKKIHINGISSKGNTNTRDEIEGTGTINLQKCKDKLTPTPANINNAYDKSTALADEQVKEMEKLKNPSLASRAVSSILYNKEDPQPNYFEPTSKYSKIIIGIITGFFTIFIIYSLVKTLGVWPSLKTLGFLFKRLFVFIFIVSLIIFTYSIFIWIFFIGKILIKYIIYAIDPLKHPTVDERHHSLLQWIILPQTYLIASRTYFILASLIIFLFMIFLVFFIILLGYLIGVSLSFMD